METLITYFSLIAVLFIIGLGSFGGGYAMIPLLYHFLVETYLSHAQFDTLLALSQALPGAFAINMATYIGYTVLPYPFLGAIITSVAIGLPSIGLSLIASHYYAKFKASSFLKLIMQTLKPTIAAFVLWAGYNILIGDLHPLLTSHALQKIGIFCILVALYSTFLKNKPIYLLGMGAFLALLPSLHFSL